MENLDRLRSGQVAEVRREGKPRRWARKDWEFCRVPDVSGDWKLYKYWQCRGLWRYGSLDAARPMGCRSARAENDMQTRPGRRLSCNLCGCISGRDLGFLFGGRAALGRFRN